MDSALFSFPDADVILRSSDGVSLRVYSRIVVEASPFFRDLLSLPQPISENTGTCPVVDVPEDSEVMKLLLMFIFPVKDPPIETLALLGGVLGAALKYDVESAVQSLRRLLVSPYFVENEPLRVYAIACRHHLEEEAKIASKHTLTINLLDAPLSEELKYITAYDYHRLLDLHRRRGEAAQKLLIYDRSLHCPQCSGGAFGLTDPPRWWIDFSNRAKVELQRTPTTDVIFTLPFLAQAALAGCQRCGTHILSSHEFLKNLKKTIDDLPATI